MDPATPQADPPPPEPKKRGRKPGSKNKPKPNNAPRTNQVPIQELADDVEMEETEENTKKTKQEKVEDMFNELNASVPNVLVGQRMNGCMFYKEPGLIDLEEYESRAIRLVNWNFKRDLVPPVQYMSTMASVEMMWRTVDSEWLNGMRSAWNTGPCLQLCRKNHTPNLPEDFRDFAYLVNCINTLPNYDNCVVPTNETRLKWNRDFSHIEGIKRLQPSYEERFQRKKSALESETPKKIFMGIEFPDSERVAYSREDAMDDDLFVSVDVATLIISVIPVTYVVGESETEEKETFWVATMVPQPGVNLLRCMERLCRPMDSRCNWEVAVAQERTKIWSRLNYVESFQSYNLNVDERDTLVVVDSMDNYTDRRHPFATMSTTSVMHKIVQALPNNVTRSSIAGMPILTQEEAMQDWYGVHIAHWNMCVRWAVHFNDLAEQMSLVRGADRRFIPPLRLPVVPGFPLCELVMDDEAGTTSMYTYFTHIGHPPLNILWQPMLKPDFRQQHGEFRSGKLPELVQGTLMMWIFGGDIEEFLGMNQTLMSEEKVFDKYYRNSDSALDEFVRAGTFSNWRESVMINVAKLLQKYTSYIELREDEAMLYAMGENEDFNDDDDFARQLRDRRPGSVVNSEVSNTEENSVNSEDEGEEREEGTEENPSTLEDALLQAVEKIRRYTYTAWMWHRSMIEGDAYQSDVIQNSNIIIEQHLPTLARDMKTFLSEFMDLPRRDRVICMQPHLARTIAGCFAMQGAILNINTVANMNAPNLTTFRELFTSSVGSYLGSSNRTWACFLWPIQVSVAFGNLELSTKDGNVPYWVKPNSCGLDSVLVKTLMSCRKLFQVQMRTTDCMSQTMIQLSRATQKALEDIGRVLLADGRIVQKPTKNMRLQLILMTEQRKMGDTLLNGLINALPRHDNASDTDNKVLSTDVSQSAGGARRGTEGIRVDMLKMVVCGTNVPASHFVEGECLTSLRSTMVLMPPGGPVDAGLNNRKRKITEVHHDSSKTDCRFFDTEEDKAKLCPGMCIAQLLATSFSLMNDFGLIRVEVSEMVNDLYAWYYWAYDTYFMWTCSAAHVASFQRLLTGWKARGVADTIIYRTIGNIGTHENTQEAIVDTLFSLGHDAHAMFLVPTQVHQNIRGLIDSQALLINRYVVSTLNIPVVPFSWLASVFTGRLEVDIHNDKYAKMVHQWLTALVVGRCFLPANGKNDVCPNSNITPYVSTPAKTDGSPLTGEGTLFRFTCNGHSTAAQVAASIISSPYARVAQISMGVPKDVNIYKNAVQAYCSASVETSLYFNGVDIYDVTAFLTRFGVSDIPPHLQRRDGHKGVWDLAKIITVGQENSRYTVFGVHCTAALMVASLYCSNAEGAFHSNMSSNAARNVMQAITRHASKSSFGGDGNTVHIKNFAFAQSGPRSTNLKVCPEDDCPRDYFLRPKFDMCMSKSGVLGYLPGRYKAYAFEDTVHLHGLLSFLHKLNMNPNNLRALPIELMKPEYEIVQHRVYPLMPCDVGKRFERGCLVVTERDSQVILEDENRVETTVELSQLAKLLSDLKCIIYPLVSRRNVLVYSKCDGFGVILPWDDGQYISKQTMSYKVQWVSGTQEELCYTNMDDVLMPLGGHIYVSFASAAVQHLLPEIPSLEGKDPKECVFRCNLFYPNGEDRSDPLVIYVNTPIYRRVQGIIQKGVCEVFTVALSDIVHVTQVKNEQMFTVDVIWVGA